MIVYVTNNKEPWTYPLGHGVHSSQVATGVLFHSSMTTSRSWWLLETLRSSTFCLRMLHRLPLPSASLARQWSISCCNTALRPSLRREGIMLCFNMSQFMLVFMVPSMNCSSPVPAAVMQPQTMTLPPPCLTVGKTHLPLYCSPGCRHTRVAQERSQKGDSGCASEKLGVPHLLSD